MIDASTAYKWDRFMQKKSSSVTVLHLALNIAATTRNGSLTLGGNGH